MLLEHLFIFSIYLSSHEDTISQKLLKIIINKQIYRYVWKYKKIDFGMLTGSLKEWTATNLMQRVNG